MKCTSQLYPIGEKGLIFIPHNVYALDASYPRASQLALVVKNLPASAGDARDAGSIPGPGRRAWQPTPVFLPRESHGQKSLAGYSPWGRKKSDTTERLILKLLTGFEVFLREGNGIPLQYFCLGNPMDRGAWRATVHVITKSQTQMCTHAPACTNFF